MTAMEKITPTHKAMETILNTIKALEMQYQELASTLPIEHTKPNNKTGRFLEHPITRKKRFYAYK